MKIGYVRVSKQEQHEMLQIDALKEAGCEKWFLDKCYSPTYSGKALRSWLHSSRAFGKARSLIMGGICRENDWAAIKWGCSISATFLKAGTQTCA